MTQYLNQILLKVVVGFLMSTVLYEPLDGLHTYTLLLPYELPYYSELELCQHITLVNFLFMLNFRESR